MFIDINSNNSSAAEHKAFIEEAIAANPNVKWKTVVFHHSIYSTASHVKDGDIINRRNELPQIFDDLDIDVVLMGHDHVYTRTYMMNGSTPDTSRGVQSSVTNSTGILYLTANSASGSKYYDIKAPNAEYSAKMDQSYRRTVTDIDVTDTSYTMTTYYADDMSVLDTFTINKTDSSALKNLVNETESKKLNSNDYTEESWNTFQTALTNAKSVLENENASQSELDDAYNALKSAMDGLKAPEKKDPEQNPETPVKPGNGSGSDNDSNTKKPAFTPVSDTKPSATDTKPASDSGKKTVRTGDTANAASAGLVMLAAGSVIVVYIRKRKGI